METIFIPALVAGFTTLLIEFFAKPSLEKRKTRILEEYKLQRELSDWIGKISFQIGAWEKHQGNDSIEFRKERLLELIQIYSLEYPIVNLSRSMGLNRHVDEIVTHLLAGLEAWKLMLSLDATNEELSDFLVLKIFPLFDLADEAILGSQVRWLPKLKLRKAFRALSA